MSEDPTPAAAADEEGVDDDAPPCCAPQGESGIQGPEPEGGKSAAKTKIRQVLIAAEKLVNLGMVAEYLWDTFEKKNDDKS